MNLSRLKRCAERINQSYSGYSLLDAGCRTKDLKPFLRNCREYFGTDLKPGDGVIECNLENKLPFEDHAFDIVTALDVLEHLDNPHQAFQEICRVARRAVFVSLPNMYYFQFRWNFLVGRGISGKYRFPSTPIKDRHRWVLSYSEALRFAFDNSHGYELEHEMIIPIRGRPKIIAAPIHRWLGRTWPNLFVYGVLFEIRLDQSKSTIQ